MLLSPSRCRLHHVELASAHTWAEHSSAGVLLAPKKGIRRGGDCPSSYGHMWGFPTDYLGYTVQHCHQEHTCWYGSSYALLSQSMTVHHVCVLPTHPFYQGCILYTVHTVVPHSPKPARNSVQMPPSNRCGHPYNNPTPRTICTCKHKSVAL